MEHYSFIEHTADIGIRAQGMTLAELFAHAAEGMSAYLGAGVTLAPAAIRTEIRASGIDYESLLVNWLSEVLFLSSEQKAVYSSFTVRELAPTALRAAAAGRRISPGQRFLREIKAVTYHRLSVGQTPEGYAATVIFDI